jgi:hypothetical protein
MLLEIAATVRVPPPSGHVPHERDRPDKATKHAATVPSRQTVCKLARPPNLCSVMKPDTKVIATLDRGMTTIAEPSTSHWRVLVGDALIAAAGS